MVNDILAEKSEINANYWQKFETLYNITIIKIGKINLTIGRATADVIIALACFFSAYYLPIPLNSLDRFIFLASFVIVGFAIGEIFNHTQYPMCPAYNSTSELNQRIENKIDRLDDKVLKWLHQLNISYIYINNWMD
jgi:hypothetical protein